ncbi:MAG: glycosyltransferase family 4 protein [Anaerolineales bacterium]
MHILFLTQILPYPPNSGPKVKTWHVIKYLSQCGHKITLASFVRPEEMPYIEDVRQVCASVHPVPMHRSRISDIGYLLRSQLTGRPFLVERDDLSEMRSLVERIVTSEDVDVIHADQLTMTQFALPFMKRANSRPKLVFDAHNAVWTITERMKQTSPFYLRLPLILETKRIKQYEGMVIRDFDATLAVTELDRQALKAAIPANGSTKHESITVIPIAVDTNQIRPVARQANSLNILTMGTLYYPPNADGIRWFVGDVFPLIRSKVPGVSLTIIGKNPPNDFLKLAEDKSNGIRVTGFVPDLDPYFSESVLAVIPVRAGGGMRVRILEAFARAMPVVTTTVGLEGIEAQPGKDVLVADSPHDFAAAVCRVLADESLQKQLSTNGRLLVERKYDWQVTLKALENVYRQLD